MKLSLLSFKIDAINSDIFLILIFALTLFNACTPDADNMATEDIDVKIKRFEQELFALDTTNSEIPFGDQLAQLEAKYPDFMTVYKEIIADPYGIDTSTTNRIRAFIGHPGVQHLYDTTQILYDDLADVEQQLETVLGRYHYYFPEKPIPEIVSFISEYSVGSFTYGDSLLAIGLDFFLGENYSYDYALFPAFLQRSMNEQHLISKTVETLASNVVGEMNGTRLLDFMIANGKILYIKSLLLPDTPEHILLEWTPEQLEWMEDSMNERELWTQILKRDLLYSTRRSEFDKLIVPSPFGATWMPRASPGKTANWIGWQIVKKYMDNHPEASVQELIDMKDAQQILDGSQYRPARD